MKKGFLYAFMGVAGLSWLIACKGEKHIPTETLKQAVILDVRTPGEFNSGHINGAVNIALSKLHDSVPVYPKDTPIITYCSHGLRSKKAAGLLREHGFTKVYDGGSQESLEKRLK